MKQSSICFLGLALLVGNRVVLGCSWRPVNPQGPWIGGHAYGWSNPLITTDSEGVLVSNLVIYNEDGYPVETMIVVNATTGSVQQRTYREDYVLTPPADITEDVTAGYEMKVDVASDNLTATIQVTPADGNDMWEYTLLAPLDGETQLQLHQEQFHYHLIVPSALLTAYRHTAYIMYAAGDWSGDDISHYAVLDLSIPNTASQLVKAPFYRAYWPVDMYEDLRIMSMSDGLSCDGRVHLHYNESHIVRAEGMGYHTFTRAIDRGETIRDNSYYSLEEISVFVESDSDSDENDDDWDSNWGDDKIVTNYTLRERDVITGDLLREIRLSMEDVQAIADELAPASSSTSDPLEHEDTDAVQDRGFVRGGKKSKGKKMPGMPNQENNNKNGNGDGSGSGDGTTTLRIQSTLLFEFFHHGGDTTTTTSKPNGDDIGALMGATLEFFREVFRKESPRGTFVDWTMTDVKPSMDPSQPYQFSLQFVSNIMVIDNNPDGGTILSARDAANIMARADYKKYIGRFARSSQSSPFHSTFKVHFKGVAGNSVA